MIGEVYKRDRDEVQDLGRHKSMETNRETCSQSDVHASPDIPGDAIRLSDSVTQ